MKRLLIPLAVLLCAADAQAQSTIISGKLRVLTERIFNSRNVYPLGPHPYYDLSRLGLYSGTGGSITCSTTASSNVASCTSAGDFAVGQGIERFLWLEQRLLLLLGA